MGIFQSLTDGLGLTNWGDQEGAMAQAQAQFAGLNLPELSPIELERMVSAGELTPELAEIIKLEGNAYKDIYVDPRLKAQQMESLAAIQEIADTGMTAQDRADLAKIASQESIAERGTREALIQQAQQKGISGSGLSLAAQLENQQGGATRRSARDTEVAGAAAQRRLAALEQAGALAGSMRSQEYGEQANEAQAQQLINQFNAQNTQAQLQNRANAQNAANAANLENAQNIMNQNVALSNQEELYRKNIAQQQYQNALGLASAKAGGYYNAAQMYGQQSQAGLGATSGLAGSLAIASAASDENVKKDIKLDPNEIDKLLEELTGYSFRYKDEDIAKGIGSEGPKVGVMAQDIEKLIPNAVFEKDDGEEKVKMLNNNELLPAVLASVGRLNDRLKKVESK